MTLTPRERVLMAANHQEPDRVPLSLWGSWYGVTDKLYFRVLEELGWEPETPELEEIIATAWEWHQSHPNGYE